MQAFVDPIIPTEDDARTARESSRRLAHLSSSQDATISVSGEQEVIRLPRSAVRLLVQLLTEMSKGNAVTLTPIHAQLTTQQAAEFLGVSRPFIIKEIRAGKIPFQQVGTHRRIAFTDVLNYKRNCCTRHNEAMNELTEQAQNLGMGY